MRRFGIMLFVVVLLTQPQTLLAWNDTGHMTVALIAYRQLSDQQKTRIAQILLAHPHYKQFLNTDVPEGVSAEEWAFIRAAAWPDWIRPARPGIDLYKGPQITHYHQGAWHYIDLPYVPPQDRAKINPASLPQPETPNAITAFDQNSRIVANASATPADRAVALAWVEHLVGDIHQPLHATSEFSSTYPKGDKGGNSQAVQLNGNIMPLHSFWDEALGTSDAYSALSFLADEITNDPTLKPAALPELTKDVTFQSWAKESLEYAGSMVYLDGRLKTAEMNAYRAHQIHLEQVPGLPPGYTANASALAKHRIADAGYRLANELTKELGR